MTCAKNHEKDGTHEFQVRIIKYPNIDLHVDSSIEIHDYCDFYS